MSDEDRVARARERYLSAAHAMQSGVEYKMGRAPGETQPKGLRVGVNSAMSNHGALVELLIRKGIITEVEYLEAIADKMEEEVRAYEVTLTEMYGITTTLS